MKRLSIQEGDLLLSPQLRSQLLHLDVRVPFQHLQRLVPADCRQFEHAEIASLGQPRQRFVAQIVKAQARNLRSFAGEPER